MFKEDTRQRIFRRHVLSWVISDPFRNLLSIIGLVLGISGIVITFGLVFGENEKIMKTLNIIGHRCIYVSAVERPLPRINYEGMTRSFPEIDRWTIIHSSMKNLSTNSPRSTMMAPVLGVNSTYFDIITDIPLSGRNLTGADITLSRPVCLIGQALSDRLNAPQMIYIGNTALTVVGVLETPVSEGSDRIFNRMDPAGAVIVPETLGMINKISNQSGQILLVQVHHENQIADVKEKLRTVFDRYTVADIRVLTSRDLIERVRSTKTHLVVIVLAISFVAIVLGGLGILNNQLSIILERLPEIGVRMSMGATRNDITRQFSFEILIITVSGSIIGLMLGLPILGVIHLVHLAAVIVPWWLPVIPPLIGTGIGVICGVYSVRRIAGYKPIETLTFR